MVYSQNLLDNLGLFADEMIYMKMSQTQAKYPVEKAKGSAAKYDQLQELKGGAVISCRLGRHDITSDTAHCMVAIRVAHSSVFHFS